MKGTQQFNKIAITSPRHGQNELKLVAAGQNNCLQIRQIVGGQQAPVGHGNDALDGKARHNLLNDALEGGDLSRVAIKHLVVQRQALSRLHHTEHHLTLHHAYFGHAVVTQLAVLL